MDLKTLRDNEAGILQAISGLRQDERTFIKANTLSEQIEKARRDLDKLEGGQEDLKKSKREIKREKAEAMKSVCDPLGEAISALIPFGRAVVKMDENFFIGWEHDGRTTPYNGLSGGEKVFFDGALCNAFLAGDGERILVLEAAELDQANLARVLSAISEIHPDAQIIVNAWHEPDDVPEEWKEIRL